MGFSIRDASKLALEITQHLQFEPELCLRHLSPRSACALCADICPAQAISIERSMTPGQMVDMQLDELHCTQCGLCTQVCPSSAFSWNRPKLLELCDHALTRSKKAAHGGQKLVLSCEKSYIDLLGTQALELPCLGFLPHEFFLYLQAAACEFALFLPDGLCERCPHSQGEELLYCELEHAERASGEAVCVCTSPSELSAYLNSPSAAEDRSEQIDAECADKGVHPSSAQSSAKPASDERREFFGELVYLSKRFGMSALGSAGKALFGSNPNDKPRSTMQRFNSEREKLNENTQLEDKGSQEASQSKEHDLAEADTHVGEPEDPTTSIYTDRRKLLAYSLKLRPDFAPYTAVRLPQIDKNCTHCKACAFLCPTEALILKDKKIELNALACIACGLCAEICWPKAIKLHEHSAQTLQGTQTYLLHEEEES